MRIRTAILLPLAVIPLALSIALFVGWGLHQVANVPLELRFGDQSIGLAPFVALALVFLITAGGFYAAYGVKGADE